MIRRPFRLLRRRVFEVFFLRLILAASSRLWLLQAASGRLWLLPTLRLPCAAAGRRGGARALAASGRHLLLRLWWLLMLRHGWGCGLLPCTAAGRCGGGGTHTLAANCRLWLLLGLRVSKALTAELLLRRFRLPSGAGGRGLAANGRLWLMLRLHLPRLWLLQ